jgi:hypothetical protein
MDITVAQDSSRLTLGPHAGKKNTYLHSVIEISRLVAGSAASVL